MQTSGIRELLKLLEQPDIISFAGGIPDTALFPEEIGRRVASEMLGDPALARKVLQYSVSEDYPALRGWITVHMNGFGVPCAIENILITSGPQQALGFLGRLLLTSGDTALVSWRPTWATEHDRRGLRWCSRACTAG